MAESGKVGGAEISQTWLASVRPGWRRSDLRAPVTLKRGKTTDIIGWLGGMLTYSSSGDV